MIRHYNFRDVKLIVDKKNYTIYFFIADQMSNFCQLNLQLKDKRRILTMFFL